MKTGLLIIVGIVVISAAVIFFSYGNIMLILFDEHYEIEITGLKDIYTSDEIYSFDYHITGYGDGCAKITATYPDEDGKTTTKISTPSCMAERHFGIINTSSNHGSLGNVIIKIPGTYKISITYDSIGSLLSETVTKEFEIIKPVFTGISLLNNNPELVKRILDYCDSTGIKLSVGLRSSNGTHTIDNNTCEWQTIEKYESDGKLNFILTSCEHTVRHIEDKPASWSNATHYINTNNCEWEYVGPATNSINKWSNAPIYKEQKENED